MSKEKPETLGEVLVDYVRAEMSRPLWRPMPMRKIGDDMSIEKRAVVETPAEKLAHEKASKESKEGKKIPPSSDKEKK